MYVVTGGAGFIGGNLVRELNRRGTRDILVVDDLTDGRKFRNLRDCEIADYLDKEEFREMLKRDLVPQEVKGIFHLGACAVTTETDGRRMLDANFAYSKSVLEWSLGRRMPVVYASSAAVYGLSPESAERRENERPLNVYGYSKLLFDQYVRRRCAGAGSTVVGLRFFNVYGPGEAHKGKMASMGYQIYRQIRDGGVGKLFQGTGGVGDGEQRRDFVHVLDIVAMSLFFMEGPPRRGILNAGTGTARSFNDLARAVTAALGRGRIEYIQFPDSLRGRYQNFTKADLTQLRATGYTAGALSLEEGIARSVAEWRREDGDPA